MSDLIDTTEMYLRTIFELEEEGIVPLRARIAERLGQSGPTVSQTVARMARDGLLTVEGDRHLQLSDSGRTHATRVMRKHRLAERLLVDVIGLEWDEVHEEACRWEHVMSEAVERKVLDAARQPDGLALRQPDPGARGARLGAALDRLPRGRPDPLRDFAQTVPAGEHAVASSAGSASRCSPITTSCTGCAGSGCGRARRCRSLRRPAACRSRRAARRPSWSRTSPCTCSSKAAEKLFPGRF